MKEILDKLVEIQTKLSKLENNKFIKLQVIDGNHEHNVLMNDTVYYNYETNRFKYFNQYSRIFEEVELGFDGLTFDDLVNILQEGDNIELDVDLVNETITINSSGGTSAIIRRSDYVLVERKSYLGFATSGSLETDAVWSIAVTITNTSGAVTSNTQYINKKWTERNLL